MIFELGEASAEDYGFPRAVGSDGAVSIVKIVSLSPRVKNLKVKKVIKVLYLNKESQCFECFSDSYAYECFTQAASNQPKRTSKRG